VSLFPFAVAYHKHKALCFTGGKGKTLMQRRAMVSGFFIGVGAFALFHGNGVGFVVVDAYEFIP
jgi:hypothetical protein